MRHAVHTSSSAAAQATAPAARLRERGPSLRHAPVRRHDPREEPLPQPLPLLRDALDELGDEGLQRSARSLHVIELYEPWSRMRDLRRER